MQENQDNPSPFAKMAKFHPKLTPKMWKRDEVLLLLKIYESTLLQSFNAIDDEELWNVVSEKLSEHEIQASPAHCKSKWNLLHKAYLANPNSQGTFFRMVKQIVEAPPKIEKLDDVEEMDVIKEEILESLIEEDQDSSETVIEEPPISSVSFTIERVTESPVIGAADGLTALIERLCAKIDTLTEIQHRQEAQLEEVYKIQMANRDHLLEIKKHLNIG
ncbi:uncharacterized protein LOC126565398 [Anopheles maculipalpis]|uniref:uncharacterized protein LOC126565398 n=1 Tax=Anopheles maculipalpis TaxID=1496333 RepID=UPI002158BAD4|nr:uncharacterized protein LOC126565398 [Anopheles maculipalpis]